MAFKLKSKKGGIVEHLTPIAAGIAGGFAGNQITSMLEKQSFLATYETYAPALTLAAAAAAGMFAPAGILKDVANGAAIVAGTELVESLIVGSTTVAAPVPAKTTAGVAPIMQGKHRHMGYTPDIQATGPNGYAAVGGGSVN